MSRLPTDVADLAGYTEPGTPQIDLDTLHIAREYAKFPTDSTIELSFQHFIDFFSLTSN